MKVRLNIDGDSETVHKAWVRVRAMDDEGHLTVLGVVMVLEDRTPECLRFLWLFPRMLARRIVHAR